MKQRVLLDEIHLQFWIERQTTPKQASLTRRALRRKQFVERIRRTLREIMRRSPTLRGLQLVVGR